MTSFSQDPSVLPTIPERKGTLNLRCDHMKYGRATLNSNWWAHIEQSLDIYTAISYYRHAAREAEPKDYDVSTTTGKKDLLKATYARIGSVDEVIHVHASGPIYWEKESTDTLISEFANSISGRSSL